MGRRLNVPEYACSAFPLMASGSEKRGLALQSPPTSIWPVGPPPQPETNNQHIVFATQCVINNIASKGMEIY